MNEWEKLPRPWIADIGCGCQPFPLANILVDKYPGKTIHRHGELRTDGKLFIEADICALPFADHSLDFVIANHVLEHVNDPLGALDELQRVSEKGVAWVPSMAREWVERKACPELSSGHKWLVIYGGNSGFVFFPYDDTDPVVVERFLRYCGAVQPVASLMFGSEIRMGWGWGDWGVRVNAHAAELSAVETNGTVHASLGP